MIKSLFKAIGFTVLIFAIYNLIYIGLAFAFFGTLTPSESTGTLVILTNFLSLGIIFLIFLLRKDRFISYVGFKKISTKNLCMNFLFGIGLCLLVTFAMQFILDIFPLEGAVDTYTKQAESLFGGGLINILLLSVISAPLFEEIIMRGIVLNDFKKASPIIVAVIIQAFVFGLFHENLIQFIYASFLGVVFGILYLKYRSIWASIICHASCNLTGIFLPYILFKFDTVPNLLYVGIGILLVGASTFVMLKDRRLPSL